MTVPPTALPRSSPSFQNTPRRVARGERPAAVLLAETVRLIEQDGPLEDQDVMREAFRDAAAGEDRLLARGRLLGRRLRLDHELDRWRRAAWFFVLPLALLAFLSAYGAAVAVIGGGRTVNVVTAFFALLAFPTLTLLAWIGALVSRGPGMFGHLSFGNFLLGMLARLPGEQRPRNLVMAHAAREMLARERMFPWAFGAISHAIWTLALVFVLAALGFAFSFQAYRLTWETTILDAGFFTRFVTLTGMLPHWLGFPLPDAAKLGDSTSSGADHRSFAWWLMGCVFTYGLLPRCLSATISWFVTRRRMSRLHLDTADPYYRKLLARFEEMESSIVVDKEQPALLAGGSPAIPAKGHGGVAVVGFELPPEFPWPPAPLPPRVAFVERIAGTGAERRVVLDKLSSHRPDGLLLVCHAASTPDRGTERFLREASRLAPRAALLLTASADENDIRRWKEWTANVELDNVEIFTDSRVAAQWMGGEDD